MDNTSFDIKIPLYDVNVVFVIGDNLFEISKTIKRKHRKRLMGGNKKEICEINGCVVQQFISEKLIYVLIGRKSGEVDIETVAHEIYHLTSVVLDNVHFNYYKNEEAFAQFNGFLNSMIIKEIVDAGEKVFYDSNKKIKISRMEF